MADWLPSVAPPGYLLGSASPWPRALPTAADEAQLATHGLELQIAENMLTGLPSYGGWCPAIGGTVALGARHIPERLGIEWVARSRYAVGVPSDDPVTALAALILEHG